MIYDSISPRQFFTRNRQLDADMKNWSIQYDMIDREKSKMDIIKRTASFSKEKWYSDTVSRPVLFFVFLAHYLLMSKEICLSLQIEM